MPDLTDIQRGKIVGARIAGATVTEISQILSVSGVNVSKVMTEYTQRGRINSKKQKIAEGSKS